MLVLSRKIDERILIGDRIVITVCGIEGSRVKIGIEAPTAIRVSRWELLADSIRQAVKRLLLPPLRVA